MTKVMWLEEDLFIIDEFIDKAQEFDLNLVCFNCWEDAKNTLMSNIKGWGAIILDPKCKLGKGDRPNPQKFLPQVFCDLAYISAKYDCIIPWYIFTGLEPSSFEDLVVDDRKKYDAEWERPYYCIKEDGDFLFNRIKMQVSSIERTKIRNGIHKDLFDKLSALTQFGFVYDDISTMEDILISLYDNKESRRCNFINLRKIIESLFKSMIKIHILPDDLKNSSGEMNLTSYATLLAFKKCKSDTYCYSLENTVLDKVAGHNLYNILKICNGYAHTKSINSEVNKLDTNKYLEITQTNNLLHACGLMLADIIIMYLNKIKELLSSSEELIFWKKTKCE